MRRTVDPRLLFEHRPVHDTIDKYIKAFGAWADACEREAKTPQKSRKRAAVVAEWDRASEAEEAALNALCAFPVETIEDVLIKCTFLAGHFKRYEISGEQLRLLLASLAG